jgi:chorismate-pyruvate lyase
VNRIIPSVALAGLTACAVQPVAPVDGLERMLASHDSATTALEQWCEQQGLANPAHVVAEPAAGQLGAEPSYLRAVLNISAEEALGVRHVHLTCGGRLLSRAQNWYVPSRLTPEMNAVLAASTTPFGKVAAPLGFRRELIETRRGPGPDCPAETVLFQRAVLRLPDGRPLAHVLECYAASAVGPAGR